MADGTGDGLGEPMSRRARRWVGRHRTSVTAAAVALMAGVVALGSVAGVQARANAALKVANKATSDALRKRAEAQMETQTARGVIGGSSTRSPGREQLPGGRIPQP